MEEQLVAGWNGTSSARREWRKCDAQALSLTPRFLDLTEHFFQVVLFNDHFFYQSSIFFHFPEFFLGGGAVLKVEEAL